MEKIREAEFLTPQKMEKRNKINFTEKNPQKKKKNRENRVGRRDDCWSSQKENRVPELLNC
jgi:hypothetical protein